MSQLVESFYVGKITYLCVCLKEKLKQKIIFFFEKKKTFSYHTELCLKNPNILDWSN